MIEIKLLDGQKAEVSWDRFLQESTRGHYGVLSGWLHSFDVYGGKTHILTLQSEGEIVGGMGMVEMGKGPFSILTVLMGPIIKEGFEEHTHNLIKKTYEFAQKLGVFLLQVKSPTAQEVESSFLMPALDWGRAESQKWVKGYPFNVVGVPGILYLVDLKPEMPYDENWETEMLSSFKKNTRRDIRRSIRNGLEFSEVFSTEEIRTAYQIIEMNAKEKGYSVRSWQQFSQTAIYQIEQEQAFMTAVKWKGEIVGAHYGVVAGKRYGYSMGGVKRLDIDLLVGHFLQWNVMIKAKKMGMFAYDFTSVGTPSVKRFKEGFRPVILEFDTPHFMVLSAWKYHMFIHLFPYVKKHKKTLAKIANAMFKRG